jgi:Family of unknown function (DUF5754)
MKLVKIVPSHKLDKKLDAVFTDGVRQRIVPFGLKGADDYTITHSKEQRDRYRQRHKKDLETGDPTKAGFLSYYILWGDSTSRSENIAQYKKRFHL